MKIHLLAVGQKMPGWVEQGFQEYRKRLPAHCSLHLSEIPPGVRSKNTSPDKAILTERDRLLQAVPARCHVVALDERGKPWRTRDLAQQMRDWMQSGDDVALMVGGPDGLHPDCLNTASSKWSLGPLTLPHPLVRVIVSEQLYRAWSLIQGHPYHRE